MAYWVEDKLEPIMLECFRANAASSNLPVLLELSSLVQSYISTLAESGEVTRAIKVTGALTQLLYSDELKKNLSTAELAGFADFIGFLGIQILLSASKGAGNRFPELHAQRLKKISWANPDSIYALGFDGSTLEQLEWLRERIIAEREIEGEYLTPDWYCLDLILLADSKALRETVPQLLEVETMFLKPARGTRLALSVCFRGYS